MTEPQPPRTASTAPRTDLAASAAQDAVTTQALITLAAAGDAQAWSDLVHRYTPRVFGLLVKSCSDRDLAEELTQLTFVKLVEKLDGFAGYQEQGKFEPWLFRVAMNALRDEKRRSKRQARTMDMSPGASSGSSDTKQAWAAAQQEVVMGGPSQGEDPLEVLDRAEQVDLLKEAVKTLSEADQHVLYLRHTAGLSFQDIADTLQQPLGTVLARGHRAVGKLRKILQDQLEGPAPQGAA